MADENLTFNDEVFCPHGGRVLLTTTQPRVFTENKNWTLFVDVHPIVGCPLIIILSPCIIAQWKDGPTQRVFINNLPLLKFESVADCYSPWGQNQGETETIKTQIRVRSK